jgi:hypothetical protein
LRTSATIIIVRRFTHWWRNIYLTTVSDGRYCAVDERTAGEYNVRDDMDKDRRDGRG